MLLRKTLYHRRLQGIFNQTFFQAKTKYPQANLSHNTSCTLPVQRSSSLTCCDFWYKSCKFNCARPVQVSGRSELTELPSSQLWERARPRVWAPSRKASVNPPTPLIDPCSRPSPANSWWPPWQPRRCWSCSGLAPPCCPGPAGRARLSETRAKQKMRSEKKITPLTVSGKRKRTEWRQVKQPEPELQQWWAGNVPTVQLLWETIFAVWTGLRCCCL